LFSKLYLSAPEELFTFYLKSKKNAVVFTLVTFVENFQPYLLRVRIYTSEALY